MKLLFTSTIIKPITPFATSSSKTTSVPQTLDTYSKYVEKNTTTFSNTTSYFSGTTMFSRVDSGVHGCSSCGLQKKA